MVNLMSDRVERLEQRLDVLFRQVNTNAGAIATKPDHSEVRSGFNEVVQWLSNQENKIDALQVSVERLQSDVSSLQVGMEQLQGDVDILKNSVQRILELLENRDGQ